MDSSPFVERPTLKASHIPAPGFSMASSSASSIDQLTKEVHRLKYQLKDLQTQNQILKLESETQKSTAEQKYETKCMEFDEISSNNVFLFKQNEELLGKLQHIEENSSVKEQQLNENISKITLDLNKFKRGYEELSVKNKSLNSKLERLQMDHKMAYNDIETEVSKLRHDTQAKDTEIESLRAKLEEQSIELRNTQDRLSASSNNATSREDYQLIKSQLSDQVSYIQSLESVNLSQSEQIKKLTLSKANSEILNSKNMELSKLAERLKLEIEGFKVKERQFVEREVQLDNLKIYLAVDSDDSGEIDMEQAVKRLHDSKQDHDLLLAQHNRLSQDMESLNSRHSNLLQAYQQQTASITDLKLQCSTLSKLNSELSTQRDLAFEESKILRGQLSELSSELQINESDKDAYIKSLVELVDDYKSKLEKVTQDQVEWTENSKKRLRTGGEEEDDDITRDIQLSNETLRKELSDLQTKHSRLATENIILLKKLENLKKLQPTDTEKKFKIVQLRNNPLSHDQFIKSEQLSLLTAENESLKNLVNLSEAELIPRAVYDTLQLQCSRYQEEINSLTKKSIRLSQQFSEKIKEFISLIYHILGFKLEFLSSTKVKLFSKFATTEFITLDLSRNTLKTSTSRDLDEQEEDGVVQKSDFETICNELIQYWVKEKGEVGLFLSALNLELFERSSNCNKEQ
ncbi:hypothetical protein WICPIJ_005711 [Wickerhamomyces pijperi]|uniref:Spindle assembly checkpoint component MAD1 n=1 Tax=Wickerhamomyces pijperi TaxID=599730 RepID=A0A9P8Q3J0_WICPI|nr:hypothetical protein WICPIJ_005711 [Wickerhamomyces pijperi]